jgi:uncharacterized protein YuzE
MKKSFTFGIRNSTDKETGQLLAVYLKVREGKSAKIKEFAHGNVFADYDSRGNLLGIELLGPCEIRTLDQITRKEPVIRRFVREAIPNKLVVSRAS